MLYMIDCQSQAIQLIVFPFKDYFHDDNDFIFDEVKKNGIEIYSSD